MSFFKIELTRLELLDPFPLKATVWCGMVMVTPGNVEALTFNTIL